MSAKRHPGFAILVMVMDPQRPTATNYPLTPTTTTTNSYYNNYYIQLLLTSITTTATTTINNYYNYYYLIVVPAFTVSFQLKLKPGPETDI